MRANGKIIALLVCISLLLGACASSAGERDIGQQRSQTIRIGVDIDAGQVVMEAAERLAAELEELSQGEVRGEVAGHSALWQELSLGNVEVALMDTRRYGDSSAILKQTAVPFRYQDYLHFTVAANSNEVLGLLGEVLVQEAGILPLAAYYQGSDFLVMTVDLAGYQPYFAEASIGWSGLEPEGAFLARPSAHGLRETMYLEDIVVEVPASARRLEMLETGEAFIAELSALELESVRGDISDYYIARSFHNINPLWLMVNESFYKQLSERQRAVVEEAGAYLFGVVDRTYLYEEEEAYTLIVDRDIPESSGLSGWRGLASIPDGAEGGMEERYLVQLLELKN